MPDTPALSDLLNPLFQIQPWVQSNKLNRNPAGRVIGPQPETDSPNRSLAEINNGTSAALRQIADIFQGLAPVTSMDVATYFGLPVFTTAARPVTDLRAGRTIWDSTLNTILVYNGTTWTEMGTSGAGFSMLVSGNGGAEEVQNPTEMYFEETAFDCLDNGDGSFSVNVGVLAVGNLPSQARVTTVRNATLLDVDNTAAETDLLDYTIPANTLDVDGKKIVFELMLDHFSNGASRTFQHRWYVGGVLVLDAGTFNQGSNAILHPCRMRCELWTLGVTQQMLRVNVIREISSTAAATGQGGSFSVGHTAYELWGNDSSADRTATIQFRVSVQHQLASSNQRTRRRAYQVSVE